MSVTILVKFRKLVLLSGNEVSVKKGTAYLFSSICGAYQSIQIRFQQSKNDFIIIDTRNQACFAQVTFLYHVKVLCYRNTASVFGIDQCQDLMPVSYTHLTLP